MDENSTHITLSASLTRDDFAAIADHCYRVTNPLVAEDKEVPPVLVAGSCRDCEVRVAFTKPALARTEAQKNRLIPQMEQIVGRPQIDFVAYVTKAWVLDDPDGSQMIYSIANHPGCEEVVLFSIFSKDSQLLVVNPLYRNPSRLQWGTLNFDREVRGHLARPLPRRR